MENPVEGRSEMTSLCKQPVRISGVVDLQGLTFAFTRVTLEISAIESAPCDRSEMLFSVC